MRDTTLGKLETNPELHSRIVYVYYLLSVVLNNYVIKQIAVKSIHKLILFIEQK